MNSEKSEDLLNIALNLSRTEFEKSTLNTGYDFSKNLWEVIVKYNGSLEQIQEDLDVQIEILSSNYAIITLSEEKIGLLLNYRQIEYIEKPKLLELMLDNALRASCIPQITQIDRNPLTGKGVIAGIIDSGIDYTHPDFINPDGTTRILYIWDQTDNSKTPPKGFLNGSEYTYNEINEALSSKNPFEIVPETDTVGHGTAVSAIVAGNGRRSGGTYKGVAYESSLIVVKLGETGRESFARNTEIMRAIKYVLDKAIELNMPIAINLSFGTNNGSHSGDSLFETYIDDMANIWKCSICVASGNEGSAGKHYENTVGQGETHEIEVLVTDGLKSLFITLWKDFSDKFNFELIAPNGDSTGMIRYNAQTVQTNLTNSTIFTNIGNPTPYNIDQQVFFEIIANAQNIPSGIWRIRIYGYSVIMGKYNIWLPVTETSARGTYFLSPTINTTLTLPSTAKNVITVGGYNSLTNSISDFSGRGYTRKYEMVKPDVVAPSYSITTANTSGGYTPQTGTSIAAPFVTGSCCILMEWGIVQGNDLFMYGQRLKAYLRLGAARDANITYPNREWGYGRLCLANVFNNLSLPSVINAAQLNPVSISSTINTAQLSSELPKEEIIKSNDYADFIVKLNTSSRTLIENDPSIAYCKFIDTDYAIVYIKRDIAPNYQINALNSYMSDPYILGLMDTSALDAAGILNIQTHPYLNLTGQGALIAIIDTGIDYTNEAFIYEDGTSKIYRIWDQTLSGDSDDDLCYGVEFTNEDINRALASENPLEIVPTTDEIGHGTFLASVSAGRIISSQNFRGAAPDAELIVVKLKQAKEYLKESKSIFTQAPAFSSADLMLGISYVKKIAQTIMKPVAICISLGTNEGTHSGTSFLEDYMTDVALKDGFIMCASCGNEAVAKHHTMVTLYNDIPSKEIEFRVGENERGLSLNIWTYLPDRVAVSLRSPLGGVIDKVQPILNSRQEINLPLENTKIIIEYPSSQFQSIGQQIKINITSPVAGIWTLTLYSELIVNGIVHIWMPITGFITNDTAFLSPDPAFTVVVPATGRNIISVGGYNHTTNSIYSESSRGPNTLGLLNPYFVAPAVNISGTSPAGFTTMTGTSVASAITTGAAALLLEWGYTKGNDYNINTLNAASYFIRGTVRLPDEIYPNNIWGYGTLNLYNTFRELL